MKPSLQRALIALRSFPSVKAAARSVGTRPETLLRMTLESDALAAAYEECLYGVVRQRAEGERDAKKREEENTAASRVTVRAEEKRMTRVIAGHGGDPRFAAAAVHQRLNRERKQERAADLEAALNSIASILSGENDVVVPPARPDDGADRWCANCGDSRVDDPCEVCGRHTRCEGAR